MVSKATGQQASAFFHCSATWAARQSLRQALLTFLCIALLAYHQEDLELGALDSSVDEDGKEAVGLQVAVALTKDDVVRAHARDELGIDIDDLANPWQVRYTVRCL